MRAHYRPGEQIAPSLILLIIAIAEIINDTVHGNPTQWISPQKHLICVDYLGKCTYSPIDLTQLENINEMNEFDTINCGVSDLPSITSNEIIEILTVIWRRKLYIICSSINSVPIEDLLKLKELYFDHQSRTKRQVNYGTRGRFRGQTQSQYLNVGNDGNEGKAEAHSDADSSRAIVTGKSGMGQAQSQTIYDPGCEDCNQFNDPGVDSLKLYPDTSKNVGSNSNFGQPTSDGKNAQPYKPFDSTPSQYPNSGSNGQGPGGVFQTGSTPIRGPGSRSSGPGTTGTDNANHQPAGFQLNEPGVDSLKRYPDTSNIISRESNFGLPTSGGGILQPYRPFDSTSSQYPNSGSNVQGPGGIIQTGSTPIRGPGSRSNEPGSTGTGFQLNKPGVDGVNRYPDTSNIGRESNFEQPSSGGKNTQPYRPFDYTPSQYPNSGYNGQGAGEAIQTGSTPIRGPGSRSNGPGTTGTNSANHQPAGFQLNQPGVDSFKRFPDTSNILGRESNFGLPTSGGGNLQPYRPLDSTSSQYPNSGSNVQGPGGVIQTGSTPIRGPGSRNNGPDLTGIDSAYHQPAGTSGTNQQRLSPDGKNIGFPQTGPITGEATQFRPNNGQGLNPGQYNPKNVSPSSGTNGQNGVMDIAVPGGFAPVRPGSYGQSGRDINEHHLADTGTYVGPYSQPQFIQPSIGPNPYSQISGGTIQPAEIKNQSPGNMRQHPYLGPSEQNNRPVYPQNFLTQPSNNLGPNTPTATGLNSGQNIGINGYSPYNTGFQQPTPNILPQSQVNKNQPGTDFNHIPPSGDAGVQNNGSPFKPGSVWPQVGPNGEKYVCCVINSNNYPSSATSGGNNQNQAPDKFTGNSPSSIYGPQETQQHGIMYSQPQSNQQVPTTKQELVPSNLVGVPRATQQQKPGQSYIVPENVVTPTGRPQGPQQGSTFQQPYGQGTSYSPYGDGPVQQTSGNVPSKPYDDIMWKPGNENTYNTGGAHYQAPDTYHIPTFTPGSSNDRPGTSVPSSSGQNNFNTPPGGISGTSYNPRFPSGNNINKPQGYIPNGVNNSPNTLTPSGSGQNFYTTGISPGSSYNTPSSTGINNMNPQQGTPGATNSQNLPQTFPYQSNVPGSNLNTPNTGITTGINNMNPHQGTPGATNSQNLPQTFPYQSNVPGSNLNTPNTGITTGINNMNPQQETPGATNSQHLPQTFPYQSNVAGSNLNTPNTGITTGLNNMNPQQETPGATNSQHLPQTFPYQSNVPGSNLNTPNTGITTGINNMNPQQGTPGTTNSQNLPQTFPYLNPSETGYNLPPNNYQGNIPGIFTPNNINIIPGTIPDGSPNKGTFQSGPNTYGKYPSGNPALNTQNLENIPSKYGGGENINYNTPGSNGSPWTTTGQIGGPYNQIANGMVPGGTVGGTSNNGVTAGSNQGPSLTTSYANQGIGNVPNNGGTSNVAIPDGSLSGAPLNVVDPNSIVASLDDDSDALVSVSQDVNGTVASASSKGGNDKGRAQTQVEGTYTGTGSFSAQAQISDDTKGAESHVSGGKHGASSSALGKGRNNKSQASVQLGSETGSLQTQAGTDGVMHSSNSQVQGSVKGGMADAQARGPGSTSSQAQIGFTPYKENEKSVHDALKGPFVGSGTASAHSTGRTGQSQTQLQGTFKYGISYNGAAQSGASLDKDTVFSNRLPFNKIDVFDESNKNIDVNQPDEQPASLPASETQITDHPHSDHHNSKAGQQNVNAAPPATGRRSFKSSQTNPADYEYPYEYPIDKDDNQPYEDENEGGYDPEVSDGDYPNYDDFNKDADPLQQSVQNTERKSLDVKQTTGGNTQHIVLGPLHNHDAEIVQKSSDQRPDESRIYQPGETVPGTGGYTIPIGFTGSVKAVSSKDKTYAIGSKDSPSQAQTVSLSPGTGKIRYVQPKPTYSYGRNVPQQGLRSLFDKQDDNNRYMSVSKSVTGALDGNNNVKKQYSHTYYTKSSSCGYFTFTCTIVSGSNGRKKVCKPKIPTNPDGTPMKC